MSVKHSIDFGKVRLGGSIGFALCSILFGMFLNIAGFRWLFWAAFIGYLFVSVVSLFLEEQAPVEHRERYSFGIIRQNRVLKTILATSFLVVGAMNMGLVFVGVYMRHLGGGEDMIGLYSGVSAGLELPVMFLSGKIIRRLGGVRSLLVGYTLYGMSFLVAGLAISPLMLLASTLLRGPGFALFMTTTIVLLDQNAGKWSAMTQAINTMGAFGIAPLIGAPLGGLIFDLFGPGKVFLVCSAMILTAIVILYASLIMHRTPKVKGGLG
jgi:PPP family 3-phenylpropionic acid transporter